MTRWDDPYPMHPASVVWVLEWNLSAMSVGDIPYHLRRQGGDGVVYTRCGLGTPPTVLVPVRWDNARALGRVCLRCNESAWAWSEPGHPPRV